MPNVRHNRLMYGTAREFVNPETLRYVNATQSERKIFGKALDKAISKFKAAGLWAKIKYAILPAPTLNDLLTVVDVKSGTILPGASLHGNIETGVRSQMTTPFPVGFYMKQTGDYIDTGFIPTDHHTVDNTCAHHGFLENITGSNNSAYGTRQGANNTYRYVPRTAGNSVISDAYSETSNAGRNTLGGGTVNDVVGRWQQNRQSSTSIRINKNGVNVGNAANGGGGLPNTPEHLGAFYSAGVAAGFCNHICTGHWETEGLTTTEEVQFDTILAEFEIDMGGLRSLTRKLIWYGNSLSVYDNWGAMRKATVYAYGTGGKMYLPRNNSVAGQTLTTMEANYAGVIAPQFDAAYANNYLIIDEIRNDIVGGTAVATVKAKLDSIVAQAKATGFKVMVNNVRIAANGGALSDTDYCLRMDEMAQYVTGNPFLADYITQVNDPRMWRNRSEFASDADYVTWWNGACANTALFTDGIHGTEEYYRIEGYNVAQNLNAAA